MPERSRHHPDSHAARDVRFGLDDYEPDEPHPFDDEPTLTKCVGCPALCIGRYCQACLPSGPDDRRVRRSK